MSAVEVTLATKARMPSSDSCDIRHRFMRCTDLCTVITDNFFIISRNNAVVVSVE